MCPICCYFPCEPHRKFGDTFTSFYASALLAVGAMADSVDFWLAGDSN